VHYYFICFKKINSRCKAPLDRNGNGVILLIIIVIEETYRAFSHDVTTAMLVFQTNPIGVEFFSYANAFFCSNKFA